MTIFTPNRLFALSLCVLYLIKMTGVTAQELSRTDKLKATYLYNFTKYIEWPDHEFFSARSPIRLCVIADQPFTAFMSALVKDRQVGRQSRHVEVIPAEQAGSCHISFFQHPVEVILPACSASLIVASAPEHDVKDAAIVFFEQHNKLRFEIDMHKARQRGVTFSAELLKLAKIKN